MSSSSTSTSTSSVCLDFNANVNGYSRLQEDNQIQLNWVNFLPYNYEDFVDLIAGHTYLDSAGKPVSKSAGTPMGSRTSSNSSIEIPVASDALPISNSNPFLLKKFLPLDLHTVELTPIDMAALENLMALYNFGRKIVDSQAESAQEYSTNGLNTSDN